MTGWHGEPVYVARHKRPPFPGIRVRARALRKAWRAGWHEFREAYWLATP